METWYVFFACDEERILSEYFRQFSAGSYLEVLRGEQLRLKDTVYTAYMAGQMRDRGAEPPRHLLQLRIAGPSLLHLFMTGKASRTRRGGSGLDLFSTSLQNVEFQVLIRGLRDDDLPTGRRLRPEPVFRPALRRRLNSRPEPGGDEAARLRDSAAFACNPRSMASAGPEGAGDAAARAS
jgi:hypothetical protein